MTRTRKRPLRRLELLEIALAHPARFAFEVLPLPLAEIDKSKHRVKVSVNNGYE